MPLQGSYTEESLVSVLTLAWDFPSRFPWTSFFSRKGVSFLKSIVGCTTCHFFADFRENIAVQLRVLSLASCCNFAWNFLVWSKIVVLTYFRLITSSELNLMQVVKSKSHEIHLTHRGKITNWKKWFIVYFSVKLLLWNCIETICELHGFTVNYNH